MKATVAGIVSFCLVLTASANLCTNTVSVDGGRGHLWACIDAEDDCIIPTVLYPGIGINPSMDICQEQDVDGSICYTFSPDNICTDLPMLTQVTIPSPDLSSTIELILGFQSQPPRVCFKRPEGECSDDGGGGGLPTIVTLPDLGGGGDETGIVGAPVLSDVDRKAFVSQHNRLRRKVKPSAANMKKMKYDLSLERFAQVYLDELPDCPLQHNPNNEDYGENVYVRSAWGNVEDVDYRSVVTLWYDEIAYYNFNTNQCSPPPGESCGHYTQIVWDDTATVGCGVKECVSNGITRTLVLCNYDPPGNVIPYGASVPRQPYTKGSACSQCPASHQACVNKLCVEAGFLAEEQALSELLELLYEDRKGHHIEEWEMGEEDGAKVADFDAHALNVSVEELGRENSNFGWIVEVI